MRIVLALLLSLFAGVNLRAGLMFQTIHPAALAWRSNCVAVQASSANYPAHFSAVNSLTVDLSQRGILQKMVYANPCAGDALAASQMTLKHPNGSGVYKSGTAITNFNFVGGDYSVSAGITGNGTTKYFNTGVNPRSHFASTNSMSVWTDVFTAASAGTSSSIFACGDAATAIALGWYGSGTIETCQLGSKQGSTGEYPNASATSLTGFLGGNVNTQPLAVTNTSVTSHVTGLPGFQGIAWDQANTTWFIMGTTAIYSRTEAGTWVITNSSPFTGTGGTVANGNHVGDGDFYSGALYLPLLSGAWVGDSLTWCSNSCVGIYDASTLQLTNIMWVTNQMPTIDAVAVDAANDYIYCASFYIYTNLWRYRLTTRTFVDTVVLRPGISRIQGLTVTNGLVLAASSVADGTNTVYAINPATGESSVVVFSENLNSNETEGLAIARTNLVLMARASSNLGKFGQYPIVTNQVSYMRGAQYWKNGEAQGLPTLCTTGLPSQQLSLFASITSGTPGSYTARRLGCSFAGGGLTSTEIGDLYAAVLRFDRALGRR